MILDVVTATSLQLVVVCTTVIVHRGGVRLGRRGVVLQFDYLQKVPGCFGKRPSSFAYPPSHRRRRIHLWPRVSPVNIFEALATSSLPKGPPCFDVPFRPKFASFSVHTQVHVLKTWPVDMLESASLRHPLYFPGLVLFVDWRGHTRSRP